MIQQSIPSLYGCIVNTIQEPYSHRKSIDVFVLILKWTYLNRQNSVKNGKPVLLLTEPVKHLFRLAVLDKTSPHEIWVCIWSGSFTSIFEPFLRSTYKPDTNLLLEFHLNTLNF